MGVGPNEPCKLWNVRPYFFLLAGLSSRRLWVKYEMVFFSIGCVKAKRAVAPFGSDKKSPEANR